MKLSTAGGLGGPGRADTSRSHSKVFNSVHLVPEAISDPGETLGIVSDPEWGVLQRARFGLLGYTFSLQNKSWSHSWVRNKTDLFPEAVSDPSEIPDAVGIALDVSILREVLSSSNSPAEETPPT